MAYFPMFVDLTGKKCIVAGGGMVAARKVKVLLEFGVEIYVAAPEVCGELKNLERQWSEKSLDCENTVHRRMLVVENKRFEDTDLDGMDMVIAATDDKHLNHRIAVMAAARGMQVDSATDKNDCTFLFPAVIKRGETVVGISSSGGSPALTAQLKRQIEADIPEDLEEKAEYLERIREKVKENVESPEERRRLMRAVTARILNREDGQEKEDI